MTSSAQFLNPSEAAKLLGISAKALRLYEQRGLINPTRTEAGWRTYGPDQMARAAEIVALRDLGLNLGQVKRVLAGDAESLESALAAHQATLEGQVRKIADDVENVHSRIVEIQRAVDLVNSAGEDSGYRLDEFLELVRLVGDERATEE